MSTKCTVHSYRAPNQIRTKCHIAACIVIWSYRISYLLAMGLGNSSSCCLSLITIHTPGKSGVSTFQCIHEPYQPPLSTMYFTVLCTYLPTYLPTQYSVPRGRIMYVWHNRDQTNVGWGSAACERRKQRQKDCSTIFHIQLPIYQLSGGFSLHVRPASVRMYVQYMKEMAGLGTERPAQGLTLNSYETMMSWFFKATMGRCIVDLPCCVSQARPICQRCNWYNVFRIMH